MNKQKAKIFVLLNCYLNLSATSCEIVIIKYSLKSLLPVRIKKVMFSQLIRLDFYVICNKNK